MHGCIKAGIYDNLDGRIIDIDVKSFYPNLAIQNRFYATHLGEEFCDIYQGIYNERTKYPKKSPENEGLKLSLNGAYGKSNDKFSFLYDPELTMKTTINGQLLLVMLAESIVDTLDCTVLQANTDGLTIKIKSEDYDKLMEICKIWEKTTKLELEFAEYDKMVIKDVNGYAARFTNGYIKEKGIFLSKREWHKSHSMICISKALNNYYFNNIPIIETFKQLTIFDFCKTVTSAENWGTQYHSIKDSKLHVEKCSKTTRYFISNKGGVLVKVNKHDGREIMVESKTNVRIANTIDSSIELKDYDINYNYYIYECNKIIDTIISTETILLNFDYD